MILVFKLMFSLPFSPPTQKIVVQVDPIFSFNFNVSYGDGRLNWASHL